MLALLQAGLLPVFIRPAVGGVKGLEHRMAPYTEDAGLPFFNRATVSTKGNWYYASALDSMTAKLCFRCCSFNIGPTYIQ